MELIMTTDLVKELPKKIIFNHDEIKAELVETLKYYNALAVTEDSIKTAKSDRASLNKLRTALEDRRISVKKECLIPYAKFETEINELIGMIDEPISAIDNQTKAFADQTKREKEGQIKAFYLANVHELEALLPLEKLYNPKWLNAGYKMADITSEIMTAITKTKNDIAIIKAFRVECEQQMIDIYLRTLDMSAAMTEKTRFEEQQAALKEYQRKQDEVKAKAAADKAAEEIKQPAPQVVEATYSEPTQPIEPQQSYIPEPEQCAPIQQPVEERKTISVTFKSTMADFRHEMGALCLKYGIKYGWTKKEDLE